MAVYKGSEGKYTAEQVDRYIRKAKKEKLDRHFEEYGYYFCTTCRRNDCVPVDCAHIKSVSDCRKEGCIELSWDLANILVEGRICHAKRDKNYIQNVGNSSD